MGQVSQNKKIVPRNVNFADWYTSLITASNLALYSSIKGEIIFQPKAWSIWTNIQNYLNHAFSKVGIKNIALPTFIRYSDFTKEKEHVSGFAPEVFLVDKKGEEALTDPYVIRPTSEVLFCEYFKKVVISYKDLPVKVNQWCNVFRAEKNTRPFLRTSEFFWHEMHSVHVDPTEAMNMCQTMINIYRDLLDHCLLIPTICGEKTIGERFAGADHTFTLEALMQDGQALQCATAHDLGQNFAKTYDISFTNKDNKQQYVCQTSAGASTRLIGALIMTHSDDQGLVLPWDVCDIQIRVIGINTNKEPKVAKECEAIYQQLIKAGYRCDLDTSNDSFGYKIKEVEVNGIPLAIIVGPNDLNKKEFTLYRRDNQTKAVYPLASLLKTLKNTIPSYQKNLYQKAAKNLKERTVEVKTMDEFKKALNQGKLILAPWGGDEADEKELKKQTGATPRCIKEQLKGKSIKCFFTNKPTTTLVYFARAY